MTPWFLDGGGGATCGTSAYGLPADCGRRLDPERDRGTLDHVQPPPAFREQDLSRRHPLIRDYPLGILISATGTGLRASPLPFVLETTGAPFGVLRGHLTRANDHGQALEGAATRVTKFLEGGEGYVDIAG